MSNLSLRLSAAPNKVIQGNVQKYESYAEAWQRIKLAQQNNFFLEAITIQESIISDRLISLLSTPSNRNPLQKDRRFNSWPTFNKIIRHWETEWGTVEYSDYPNLITAVDQWRRRRNNIIHSMVKSDPGQPTQAINTFLEEAQAAAAEGEKLAKAVSRWQRQQKKQLATQAAIPSHH